MRCPLFELRTISGNGCRLFALLVLTGLAARDSSATIVTFTNLAAFDAAAGSPAIAIDFDAIATGTNLAGSTVNGVTFSSPGSNTLDVVAGASTFTNGAAFSSGIIDASTNKLFPTSGENVLSPGGAELVPGTDVRELDSLQLDFSTPLAAFGLDILYQSFDFAPFTTFSVFDSSSSLLASGSTPAGPGGAGAPGGSAFLGWVSDAPATNIARIIFTESDDNASNPDSNIGYDTFRFGASQVPEPGSLWLLLFSLAGLRVTLRKRADS